LKIQGSNLTKIFKEFDSNGDGMLNFGEFSSGIRTILSINQPTLEKMFNLMDLNQIGMVDFDKFYHYLKVNDPSYHILNG
jgi:Ca2+-binding EF-hand superfamily protein